MKWPSDRIANTSKKSFGMFEKAAACSRQPVDLIHLEVGRPCHDTPAHIKEATIAALEAGDVHYSDVRGLPRLRSALADKLAVENGINVGADGVLITNGLTHGSYAAFMAALDPGDEVILLDPYYPQHINKIELTGAIPVLVPTDANNGFAIRQDWIEQAITLRTRMIVLINPCNPTGRVYSEAELGAVAGLACRHDLLVVSDEVYEHIIFDGNRHISIASLPGMAERTISLFAFTKAYAMDGWRLGYIAADPALIPAMLKITLNDATHVNTFIQAGALAAVQGSSAGRAEMVEADRRARELVVERLNRMPGIRCAMPAGTIYAFADVRETGQSSAFIANGLLDYAGVVVEDGGFYGEQGEGHIRICFGSEPLPRIEEAMNRMQDFFENLDPARDQYDGAG